MDIREEERKHIERRLQDAAKRNVAELPIDDCNSNSNFDDAATADPIDKAVNVLHDQLNYHI